jgi:hypothetical protein
MGTSKVKALQRSLYSSLFGNTPSMINLFENCRVGFWFTQILYQTLLGSKVHIIKLDINDLNQGVYLLQIKMGNQVYVRKLNLF